MMNQYTREAVTQRLRDGNIRKKLRQMERDESFNTRATSYSANSDLYPDGQIPFVEKHITYLMNHPKVDCEQYLSNLRLMLKVRG